MKQSARETLVNTMIDIIAGYGFDGLSVRGLAAAAGVSVGAVQHHFPSKSAMVEAAMAAVESTAFERYAQLDQIAEPADKLHAVADLLIPGEGTDRIARVWIAFAARAAVDDKTSDTYTRLWTRLRSGLRLLIAASSGRSETAADAAHELLSLLDGLTLSVIAEGMDPARARQIAHRRVDEIVRQQVCS